jgi:hypothetical protein
MPAVKGGEWENITVIWNSYYENFYYESDNLQKILLRGGACPEAGRRA